MKHIDQVLFYWQCFIPLALASNQSEVDMEIIKNITLNFICLPGGQSNSQMAAPVKYKCHLSIDSFTQQTNADERKT